MQSGKLAKLAGVTSRTLKHYRTIGLLKQVRQNENGYYEYGIDDFLRVLKIKNLAALGFSLEKIGQLLEDESMGESCLEALDAQLKAQIEALQRKRATVAALRSTRLSPFAPTVFSEFLQRLEQNASSPKLCKNHQEELLMIEHLLEPSDVELVAAFYRALLQKDLLGEYCELQGLMEHLREHADENLWEDAARKHAEFFQKMGADNFSIENDEILEKLLELFSLYDGEEFCLIQKKIAERVLEMLDETENQ